MSESYIKEERQARIATYVDALVKATLVYQEEEQRVLAKAMADGLNSTALLQVVKGQLDMWFERDRSLIVQAVQKTGGHVP